MQLQQRNTRASLACCFLLKYVRKKIARPLLGGLTWLCGIGQLRMCGALTTGKGRLVNHRTGDAPD